MKRSKSAYKKHKRQPTTSTAAELYVLKRSVKAAIRSDTKIELNKTSTKNNFWHNFLNRYDTNKKSNSIIDMLPNDINDFYVSITRKINPILSLPTLHPDIILSEYKFILSDKDPCTIRKT